MTTSPLPACPRCAGYGGWPAPPSDTEPARILVCPVCLGSGLDEPADQPRTDV